MKKTVFVLGMVALQLVAGSATAQEKHVAEAKELTQSRVAKRLKPLTLEQFSTVAQPRKEGK